MRVPEPMVAFSFMLLLNPYAEPAFAETESEFTYDQLAEQVLVYMPVQRNGVSDADYSRGVFFLEQTRSAVQNEPGNFVAADYWNVGTAFAVLGEPVAHVALAFQKAIDLDPVAICGYLGSGSNRLETAISEMVLTFRASCPARLTGAGVFEVQVYISENGYNAELVQEIYQIFQDDQRFRPELNTQQAELDELNQARIDALVAEHGGYIGRSFVGEELEFVMFLVIQHSHLAYMEHYLPYVHAAVLDGELGQVTPLKMLLDRIYVQREGYQIYGSQGDHPLADSETRRAISEAYQIPVIE